MEEAFSMPSLVKRSAEKHTCALLVLTGGQVNNCVPTGQLSPAVMVRGPSHGRKGHLTVCAFVGMQMPELQYLVERRACYNKHTAEEGDISQRGPTGIQVQVNGLGFCTFVLDTFADLWARTWPEMENWEHICLSQHVEPNPTTHISL